MKMQRLHLLAMEEERQSLMDALLQFGRLEIRQTEDLAADPDWAVLLHPEPAELVRWRASARGSFWMRRHCGSSRRWQRRSWAIRPARISWPRSFSAFRPSGCRWSRGRSWTCRWSCTAAASCR